MNTKQIVAIIAPIVLIAVMFPIFQLISRRYGNSVGWFSGLVIYWILWGTIYPILLLGNETITSLIHPPKVTLTAVALTSIPIIFVAIGRFGMGVKYEKDTSWMLVGLLITAVGNGIFEEIFWRGTYLALFPGSMVFQIIWPSVWFALWHYAPGSVSPEGNVVRLMVGALFFGLFLSVLARVTNTIWWPIVAHTLAGIVMVI